MSETNVRFSTANPALKRYRHQLTIVRDDGSTERLPAIETEDDIISLTGGCHIMTKRAVIVGVNDYSVQGASSLRYCVPDAAAFYHLLRDAFLFDPQNLFYLVDSNATSERIRQTLRFVLAAIATGGRGVLLLLRARRATRPSRQSDADV